MLRLVGFEPTCAKHGCQGQRDQQRHQNGGRQGDGELSEKPFDKAAHEQNRDEYHHQRQVHRQQGEANLTGADIGGAHRRHTLVDMSCNVFQDHDGVIDHQPSGEDQGHQR